jgi:hypothetical protein
LAGQANREEAITMNAPDWKIMGALGLVVGLTFSGLSVVSRTGAELSVQAIELRGGAAAPTAVPKPPPVDDPASPTPSGDVAVAPTPSLAPAPSRKPRVVAPPVVSERPAASPEHVPAGADDDAADDADDDAADDAADAASDAADEAEHGD